MDIFVCFSRNEILILLEKYAYHSHWQHHLGAKNIQKSLFILTEIIGFLNRKRIRPDHFPLCCLFHLGNI